MLKSKSAQAKQYLMIEHISVSVLLYLAYIPMDTYEVPYMKQMHTISLPWSLPNGPFPLNSTNGSFPSNQS